MLRFCKWLLLILLSVGLAFAGLVLIFNFHDESLRPEVAEALTFEPKLTDKQKAAYFFALGVHSDHASAKFEAAGRALFEEFLRLPPDQRAKFWSEKVAPKNPWDETFVGCVPEYKVCTSDFVKKYPEIKQELNHGSGTMEEYIALLDYGTIGDIFRGDRELPFTKIWLVSPRMHRKLLLQLAVWIAEGHADRALQVIEHSNQYVKSLFNDGSLFEVIGAAQILADNADFVKAEQALNSKLKITDALRTSFKLPPNDEIFANTVRRELRILKNLCENFAGENEGPLLKPALRRLLPMRYVLLPAETYNEYWTVNHGQQPDRQGLSGTLENPLGKEVLRLTDLKLPQRRARIEALLQKARDF